MLDGRGLDVNDPAVSRDGYGPSDVAPFHGVLAQLSDPAGYRPCGLDMVADAAGRGYWLDLFGDHIVTLADHAVEEVADAGGNADDARRRIAGVVAGFRAWLNSARQDPAAIAEAAGRDGGLTILDVCDERERRLRAAGFADPYRLAKEKETASALRVLPDVLAGLDAMPDARRRLAITRGVFAGNIFDLGATQTQSMFKSKRVDFAQTLARLRGRPWLVDDADAWLAGFERGWRCPLVFIDNAGPDAVLGMLPLVRELLRGAERAVLAANTFPSLNDVTIDELADLLDAAGRLDGELAEARRDGRLVIVGSGNGAPLIDLRRLSPELTAIAERGVDGHAVDLIVLEGMGRAVESNYDAAFSTDTLKVCMVKDRGVAAALGGEVFDLVLRFSPGGVQ
jgi:type II pantothenate kinase